MYLKLKLWVNDSWKEKNLEKETDEWFTFLLGNFELDKLLYNHRQLL